MRTRTPRRRRWTVLAGLTLLALLTLVPVASAGHTGAVQLGHTHVTTELTGFLGHSNMPLLYAANDWGNGLAGVSRGFGVGVYGAFERTTGAHSGVRGDTLSTSFGAVGVLGQVSANPAGNFSAGVRGINAGTTNFGIGVYGSQAGSGVGVYGHAPSGSGVLGASGSGTGIWGSSTSGKAGLFSGQLHATGDITRAYAFGDESRATPIAYGQVSGAGTLTHGTTNITGVSWEGAPNNRYRIAISGHTYLFSGYVTTITVTGGSPLIATESSQGGDLLVYVHNLAGGQVQAPFQFVSYRR